MGLNKLHLLLAGILGAAIGGILVSCTQQPATSLNIPVEKQHHIYDNITWYPTPISNMPSEYQRIMKHPVPNGKRLGGFTAQYPDGHYEIYSPLPKTLDDGPTCVLGHEMLHVMYGSYHDDSVP